MKIMVIGGAGYIGSALVPKLTERGYDVTVIDLLWFGNNLPENVNVIRRNCNDLTEKSFSGYDQVIFLGGLSNDPMAEYSPSRNFQENGATPPYMAWLAQRAGVKRFIYGGTCSVYGYTVNELYDESRPARSTYPYGLSKLIGESGVLQLQGPKYSTICFRQGTVSGYSPRMRFDLIVNTMFKTAVQDGVVRVNNPAIWRPILSIRDAVTAYTRAVEAPYEIGGVFNIASGNFTVGEVADIVRQGVIEKLGIKPKLEILNMQDFRNYKVATQKASDVLSVKAGFSVPDIVNELCELRETFGDFSDPSYYNITTFKALEVGGSEGRISAPALPVTPKPALAAKVAAKAKGEANGKARPSGKARANGSGTSAGAAAAVRTPLLRSPRAN
jgi:nucleoside-diphosphate-sugar epimerase